MRIHIFIKLVLHPNSNSVFSSSFSSHFTRPKLIEDQPCNSILIPLPSWPCVLLPTPPLLQQDHIHALIYTLTPRYLNRNIGVFNPQAHPDLEAQGYQLSTLRYTEHWTRMMIRIVAMFGAVYSPTSVFRLGDGRIADDRTSICQLREV